MITEQQIKELAYAMWEEEGRPEGKELEHYFRAKQMLVNKKRPTVIELPAAEVPPQLMPGGKIASKGRRKR